MSTPNKKISCQTAMDMMYDHIDGLLSNEKEEQLNCHLKACDSCKKEFSCRKQVIDLVADSGEDAPKELYTAVMASIDKEPKKAKILFPKGKILDLRTLSTIGATACAAFILLVAGRNVIPGMLQRLDKDETNPLMISRYVNDEADGVSYYNPDNVKMPDGVETDVINDIGAEGLGGTKSTSDADIKKIESLFNKVIEDRKQNNINTLAVLVDGKTVTLPYSDSVSEKNFGGTAFYVYTFDNKDEFDEFSNTILDISKFDVKFSSKENSQYEIWAMILND